MIFILFKCPGLHLGAVLFSTFLLVACGDKDPEEKKQVVRPVKLMTIEKVGVGLIREFPGQITARQSVELSFEVPGKIIDLPISDGMNVEKGALLGRLDESDFVAARDSAEANRKASQSAYERAKRIFDQGAGSQAEVDKALRNIDVATQELKRAQKALSDTALKAPFSGKVSRKIAENFENVQAKQTILLLEDISSLEIDVNVPEQDFVRMKPGLNLEQTNELVTSEIEVSTVTDRRFAAELISFETTADPVTRTYLVTFAFERPEDVNVLPGMTAMVVVSVPAGLRSQPVAEGMLIPAAAVVVDTDDSAYVWRYDTASSQVSRADVTVGDMSAASIQVLSGLENGDTIAISGATHLQEGMKVRPLD